MKRFPSLLLLIASTVVPAYGQFQYTSLDAPGANLTRALGINDRGQVVGSFRITPPRHAYILEQGIFTLLDPAGVLGTNFSEARGINNKDQIVGYYTDQVGLNHGFLLYPGVLTTLDVNLPNAAPGTTVALKISELGDVVGFYTDNVTSALHGYLWHKGVFTEIDVPGSVDTACFGINARGDIVGGWDTALNTVLGHGFVLSDGQFTKFDAFGNAPTQANAISDQGQIVGVYSDSAGNFHGFLADGSTFTTVDFPGAISFNIAWDIDNAGQIVGDYELVPGVRHGFLATPVPRQKPPQ